MILIHLVLPKNDAKRNEWLENRQEREVLSCLDVENRAVSTAEDADSGLRDSWERTHVQVPASRSKRQQDLLHKHAVSCSQSPCLDP